MSSNLPPGVTSSMIPGNSPEDALAEEMWEKALQAAHDAGYPVPDDLEDATWFTMALDAAMDFGRRIGYDEGKWEAKYVDPTLE